MDVSDDKFRVFISHKHDDHVLAERVKCLIESLNKKTITCFVSGSNRPIVVAVMAISSSDIATSNMRSEAPTCSAMLNRNALTKPPELQNA